MEQLLDEETEHIQAVLKLIFWYESKSRRLDKPKLMSEEENGL